MEAVKEEFPMVVLKGEPLWCTECNEFFPVGVDSVNMCGKLPLLTSEECYGCDIL